MWGGGMNGGLKIPSASQQFMKGLFEFIFNVLLMFLEKMTIGGCVHSLLYLPRKLKKTMNNILNLS